MSESALVLIEWGERFPRLMPAERAEVSLFHSGGDRRRIEVTRVEAKETNP